MSKELTDEQLKRQDEVDNAIFALVTNLVPDDYEPKGNAILIHFDHEWIGEIRDKISEIIAEHLNLIPGSETRTFEQAFYPFIED
jgi:hypothetical protein